MITDIPVELIGRQAECALDSAEMCVKGWRLAEDMAGGSSNAWHQLIQCASHVLDSARCVAEATRSVAHCAMTTPSDVMPLLERIRGSEISASVLTATRDLMRSAEVISDRCLKAYALSDQLLGQSKGIVDLLMTVVDASMSDCACQTLASTLSTVAACAHEAADVAASTAVAVGDVQRYSQSLAEMMDWRGVEKEPAEEKNEADDQTRKDGLDAGADDHAQNKEIPFQQQAGKRRLLQKLNREILGLQQEMRSLMSSNPRLLPEVGVAQKELLFSLVTELVGQARRLLSRAWRTSNSALGLVTEKVFHIVKTAGDWERLASPPFESRLLRVAALVDSALLAGILHELLEYCTALAPDGKVNGSMEARFSAAVVALCSFKHDHV